jgi:hypothetical protein
MSNATQQTTKQRNPATVRPSVALPANSEAYSPGQEIKPFGKWVDKSIWVPPKDSSELLAKTMLSKHGPLTSQAERWSSVIKAHRSDFTHVREIELDRASIRLPQGRFFVTVTRQKDFDKITDTIPACVQTRLDEFLAGPGRQRGVKVSYLKPLCVEVGDELILTSRNDLMDAVTKIQDEVFKEYRRLFVTGLPMRVTAGVVNAILALPRSLMQSYLGRKEKLLNAYHAKLEFRRRKSAMRASKAHRKCFTTGCTFDEMLEFTGPLERTNVIEQYAVEHELSRAERDRLLQMAAGTLPWFVTLSLAVTYFTAVSAMTASPVMVCDPAFVAEMPDAPGVLLKIGHFDEIGGVTHVEI